MTTKNDIVKSFLSQAFPERGAEHSLPLTHGKYLNGAQNPPGQQDVLAKAAASCSATVFAYVG
jgi:hypothetical protein